MVKFWLQALFIIHICDPDLAFNLQVKHGIADGTGGFQAGRWSGGRDDAQQSNAYRRRPRRHRPCCSRGFEPAFSLDLSRSRKER